MALLDDENMCPAPFTGLTINPQGEIVLCCASGAPIAHMNNVQSLESFYNSSQMQYYRNTFLNNKQNEVLKRECISCTLRQGYNVHTRRDALRDIYAYNFQNLDNDLAETDKPLRYLEFTTSNICNQCCAMCGPKFSSKWVSIVRNDKDIRKLATYKSPNYVMSNEHIEKIISVLPTLEYLVIKGGEPFADENNFKILSALNKVNKTCVVKLVSNCSNVPDNMLELLKERAKSKPVKITASIDGINDLYYWIRSTEFNKTVQTLEKIFNVTKKPIDINITVSLYNIYNLIEIFEFFHSKPYVNRVHAADQVQWPRYASPSMLPPEEVERISNDIRNSIIGQTGWRQKFYGITTNWWNADIFRSYKEIDEGLYEENHPRVAPWIKKMNEIRGMDLYSIVPQLKEFF